MSNTTSPDLRKSILGFGPWSEFCYDGNGDFNWYSDATAIPEEDCKLCQADAAAGVPAAVAKYTAYAAFRMKS